MIIIIRRIVIIIIIIIIFFKHSCFMYFQMKLHYNQTFSKILTQQKFSIYYRPASISHHLYYLLIIHKIFN